MEEIPSGGDCVSKGGRILLGSGKGSVLMEQRVTVMAVNPRRNELGGRLLGLDSGDTSGLHGEP